MKLKGKRVIWPANIDSTKSRLEGRKIPKAQSVQNPRLDEMVDAAHRLSIETEIVEQKSRPRTWWEKTGYVIVAKDISRPKILRGITTEIRKARAAKPEDKARKP